MNQLTQNSRQSLSPLRWVPSLYFAMGLPFVVLNMVSAVLFKDLGISDAQIAFWTSLIMWPWTIKFLWSPFLEIFRTKKFFVVTTQLLSGILFGLAALSLHLPSFSQMVMKLSWTISSAVFASCTRLYATAYSFRWYRRNNLSNDCWVSMIVSGFIPRTKIRKN